ncbi:MAG: hypothetical protein JWL77_3730 [Chthonomonadaceae bacterium]|nr:hypothetical protein [Chthonomonadaceae bacterium]
MKVGSGQTNRITHSVVVEWVEPTSQAERAGISPGCRLFTYQGYPLLSPEMLMGFEENSFGDDAVILEGEWKEQKKAFTVKPGKLGLRVRPDLPEETRNTYEAGSEALRAERSADAARMWSELAESTPHPTIASWLFTKAGALWESLSDWQAAQRCYRRASRILRGGQDTAAQAETCRALGRCIENLGKPDSAILYYMQAQKVDERANRPMWVTKSLNRLGNAALHQDRLSAAHDFHTQALNLRIQLVPGSSPVADSLNNLGLVAHRRGHLTLAQRYLMEALALDAQLHPDSLAVADSLNNLGNVAFDRGDLIAAQTYHTDALRLRERLKPESLAVAASLTNLGNVARLRGDLDIAETYNMRALDLNKQLAPDSLPTANSFNNLGIIAFDLGKSDVAETYHVNALHHYKKLAPDSLYVAKSLSNLGNIAFLRRELVKAQNFLMEGLLLRKRLAPESPDVAESFLNLGNVALELEQWEIAESYYTNALDLYQKLAPNSLAVANSLHNLGDTAYLRGRLADSQRYHAEALRLRERLAPGSLDIGDSLDSLGRLAARENRPEEALERYREAVQIIERHRSRIASAEERAFLMARHTRKYAGLIQGYLALQDTAAAFSTLERSRARSFLEILSDRKLDLAANAPAELVRRQEELGRTRIHAYNQLSKLSAAADNASQIDALHQRLRELDQEQQELTAHVRAADPHYASLQYPEPIGLQAAQQTLEPGALLLSYLVAEERTILFAVTSDTIESHTLPLSRKELQEKVRAFRSALDPGAITYRPAQAVLLGRRLYADLIQPIRTFLGKAKRLLLCPDGPLHTLPFGALVTTLRGAPSYLGTEKPLRSILSMTIYAQMRRRESTDGTPQAPTQQRLLAFGDPLYAAPASSRSSLPLSGEDAVEVREPVWRSLPHTRVEVENIAQLFAGTATVRLGAAATKANLFQESADADLLHFACHGWLDPRLALSSALVLSPGEASGWQELEGDNGFLYAWEIFQKLKLTADLVVLSACDTGLGQELRGEGLIGLARAFHYAGARSLVVSLWKVDDASTSLFMQSFYAALKQGADKEEALQRGALALQTSSEWNAPYYWSAFVLISS